MSADGGGRRAALEAALEAGRLLGLAAALGVIGRDDERAEALADARAGARDLEAVDPVLARTILEAVTTAQRRPIDARLDAARDELQ